MPADRLDIEGLFITSNDIMNCEELSYVNRCRRSLDEKIKNGTVTEEEILDQIKKELTFLQICETKIEKLKKLNVVKETDFKVLGVLYDRINEFYITLLKRFDCNENKVLEYIKFASQNEFITTKCIDVLDEIMLSYHKDPRVYIAGANFVIQNNNDIKSARKYMKNGTKFHSDNKDFSIEDFGFEVLSIMHGFEELPVETALTKYNDLIKKFEGNMNFHFGLLSKALNLSTVTELQTTIIRDLVNIYRKKNKMWQRLAKVTTGGVIYNLKTQVLSYEKDNYKCISNCISIYETALLEEDWEPPARLKLWDSFLEEIIEINDKVSRDNTTIKNYMTNIIRLTFKKALDSEALWKVDHFIYWANHHEENEGEILLKAQILFPTSLELWTKLFTYYLGKHKGEQAMAIFNTGISKLKNNSLKLWEIFELHTLTFNDNVMMDEFYNHSSILVPYEAIKVIFRPRYLEWFTLIYGLDEGRHLFQRLKILEPPCLELYRMMIRFEGTYDHVSQERKRKVIRRLYSDACSIFGDNNINIWKECMRFESENGTKKNMDFVYNATSTFLTPDLRIQLKKEQEELESEFKYRLDPIEVVEINDENEL